MDSLCGGQPLNASGNGTCSNRFGELTRSVRLMTRIGFLSFRIRPWTTRTFPTHASTSTSNERHQDRRIHKQSLLLLDGRAPSPVPSATQAVDHIACKSCFLFEASRYITRVRRPILCRNSEVSMCTDQDMGRCRGHVVLSRADFDRIGLSSHS